MLIYHPAKDIREGYYIKEGDRFKAVEEVLSQQPLIALLDDGTIFVRKFEGATVPVLGIDY